MKVDTLSNIENNISKINLSKNNKKNCLAYFADKKRSISSQQLFKTFLLVLIPIGATALSCISTPESTLSTYWTSNTTLSVKSLDCYSAILHSKVISGVIASTFTAIGSCLVVSYYKNKEDSQDDSAF